MDTRGNNYDSTSIFKSVDWITLVIYFILVISGAVTIYASTYDFDHASMFSFAEFSGKQFMWIGISFVVGFSMMLIDKRLFETYAYPIYALMMVLLLITRFISTDGVNGSHSWIVMGPVSLQPAEFAKCATSLALAKLFSSYNFVLNKSFSNYLKCFLVIFLPIGLIIFQNETGSALVYFSLFFVLYREGMSGLVLFIGLCAITFFVVAIKYAETMVLGIPTGIFSVFVMIMLIVTGMLFTYCKSFFMGRNVALGYIASGIIVFILSLFDIDVNGYIYFGVILVATIAYILLSMFKRCSARSGKYSASSLSLVHSNALL